MHCSDLNVLLQKYAAAESKEDLYIKRLLEDIAELFQVCDQSEYYYADMITRNFCRVIDMLEKKQRKEKTIVYHGEVKPQPRFQTSQELARAFYNHFKEVWQVDYTQIPEALESGRKELVNATMKDYVARIYTFSKNVYLAELFGPEQLGNVDPVLFTYENIERILATFKTRDGEGHIVKQRVNIRSALRKLNEFKQSREAG